MITIIVSIALLYALFVVALWQGWQRTPLPDVSDLPPTKLCVSVVVAMRNEEANITRLLDCLKEQQFDGAMEVIVVDDHSTDRSVALAEAFIAQFPCPLLVIKTEGIGKKSAISTGLRHAKYPLILTTDADCLPGKRWVQTMALALSLPQVNLVTGLVKIEPADTWLSRFQAIELAALMGSTAAFAAWQIPNMGNGANLGYRREIFEQTGGYSTSGHVASGDDEYLIQQVHEAYPGSVHFVKHADSIVSTAPQPDWLSLLMQRRRWAAKWRTGRPARVWGVALAVGLFHLFWAALLPLALWLPEWTAYIIFAFSLKLATEYVFLNAVLQFTQQKTLAPYIIPLQLVYSCYVVWVGLRATRGGYQWKERVFTR